MLTLNAEVPMFCMSPATFRGSQTASHWHCQVHCSALALRSYSHCLSPSKNGCNLGKCSQAAVWDSPWNEALQVRGFQTHIHPWQGWGPSPGDDTTYGRWTPHCPAGCSYDGKPMLVMKAPRLPCWKCMVPDPLHRFTCSPHLLTVCCLGIRLKTHQADLFAICPDNFCHNTVPFPPYSQKMIIQYEDNRDLQQTIDLTTYRKDNILHSVCTSWNVPWKKSQPYSPEGMERHKMSGVMQ